MIGAHPIRQASIAAITPRIMPSTVRISSPPVPIPHNTASSPPTSRRVRLQAPRIPNFVPRTTTSTSRSAPRRHAKPSSLVVSLAKKAIMGANGTASEQWNARACSQYNLFSHWPITHHGCPHAIAPISQTLCSKDAQSLPTPPGRRGACRPRQCIPCLDRAREDELPFQRLQTHSP